jgi:glycosyltransferase involved in cell wall biosynthesis
MKAENPLISIIIPTFNRSDSLPVAINSIFHQTYTNYEIIVVDDGSTDNTKEITAKYPEIIYIYQDNHGVSSARNVGIQHAKGNFIAFLDSDDYWMPNKLELQIKEFSKSPSLCMVTSAKINTNKKSDVFSDNAAYKTKKFTFFDLINYNYIVTSSVLVKRNILTTTGLFDTTLKTGEDWDLWLKIVYCGPILSISMPLVIKKAMEQSLSVDRYEIYKNNIKVFDKWNPLKNLKSPLAYEKFIKIVIKHSTIAVFKLLKSKKKEEALLLWDTVNTTFHFTSYDRIYIYLYYHLICFKKLNFYPLFFIYSKQCYK